MKLCSITLTSETRETIIGPALRSCEPWVDLMLIVRMVDLGATHDTTLAVAQAVAGHKYRQLDIPMSTPFADMRNAGLTEAARLGCDWAMQLDTDERMSANGVDVRVTLMRVAADTEVVTVMADTGVYDKPRFFRLPNTGRFVHAVHEDYQTTAKTVLMPKMRFYELPKSPATIARNRALQIQHLKAQIVADPANSRWSFYLGLEYEMDGNYTAAISNYTRSKLRTEEPSTKAWLQFRLACCERARGDHPTALEHCVRGMLFDASFAELYWLAGLCCYYMGLHHQAIAWEKSAAAHSWRRADTTDTARYGFKYPPALYEAPYEVLAESYKALGNHAKECWASQELLRARKEREKYFASGV